MAYDIGPKIGIDGEAEFRQAISSVTTNIKTLGSEMKVVTSLYDSGDKSVEALAAQNDVLSRSIDEQQKKVSMLRDMLDKSADKYGENDEKTKKWQQAVNNATADLNKMERQLKENESAMEDLGEETDDAGDATKDLGSAAEKSKKGLSALTVAAGNLVSKGISAVVSGIGSAVSALVNLDQATEEYRVAKGKLQTAFEAAGYSTDAAKQSYEEFYKILGDTDTAAEASQLLAKLADSEEDIATWTEIAAGVYGTFGDALPIEGLIEAANETTKTSKVTGVLADALNWAGISEDAFNESLAACTSESERNQLIMDTLAGTYDTASEAFYKNNEELVKSRENQAKLDEVTGRLGETVSSVKNALLEKFGPAIVEIGGKIAEFIEGVDTDLLFSKFDDAWKSIVEVWDEAEPYFDEIWGIVKDVFSTLKSVWEGDFGEAWSGVKSIFFDTMDFFSGIGHKIVNGLVAGMNEARSSAYGEFGGTGNGGGFGNAAAYGAQQSQIDLGGADIYLDGRKVGKAISSRQSFDARAEVY